MSLRRAGFTIIELMVVLAITGVLLSLLIPAAQSARESARGVMCRSNLRQLALGLHGYHEVHGSLPPACFRLEFDGFSWRTRILPFVDQASVYQTLLLSGTAYPLETFYAGHARPIPAGTASLAVFRCPSSLLPSSSSMSSTDFPVDQAFADYGTADYKGVGAGLGMFSTFFCDRQLVSFASVTDGLSNTLCLGESCNPGRNGADLPLWICNRGDAGATVSIDTLYPINCTTSFGGRFWKGVASSDCALSLHPKICYFALGDGSVRALPEVMNRRTYHLMGCINDGQVVADY